MIVIFSPPDREGQLRFSVGRYSHPDSRSRSNHLPFDSIPPGIAPEQINIADLKNNIAVVAVTAFGIAERADPIGPRQTRTEIETLLKTTGLDTRMKNAGIWADWESGQRGRLP